MPTEWTLIKNILLTAYAARHAKKELTRRKLGTLIYILDTYGSKILEEFSTASIYPDGIDIPDVNILIDVLRSSKLIEVNKRDVRITDSGVKKVEEILSNPDDHDSRLNYRLISYLISRDYNTLMNLALYISSGKTAKPMIGENLSQIIRDINDILDRYSERENRKIKEKLLNKR